MLILAQCIGWGVHWRHLANKTNRSAPRQRCGLSLPLLYQLVKFHTIHTIARERETGGAAELSLGAGSSRAVFYWKMKCEKTESTPDVTRHGTAWRCHHVRCGRPTGTFRPHALSFPGTKLPSNIRSRELSSRTTVAVLGRKPTRYSMHHYELFNSVA